MGNRIKYNVNEYKRNRFYQMPKFLFTAEFKNLSNDAKVLYTLLRDRHELSLKNGWIDQDRNIYFLFSRENMGELLNLSGKTVTKAVKELKKFELIEEVRQGMGQANKIYLLVIEAENVGFTKNRKFSVSRPGKFTHRDTENLRPNNTNINKTNFNETYINNNPVESAEQENADAVVVVQQIKDLISSQLHKDLTDTQITKIIQTKGFDYERLEKIIQIAKGQNIKSLVGWLIAAIKNPDFDLKPKSVDGSVNALDSTKNHKNKICNYKGANWDFDKLKELERQLIDERIKERTYDMRE